MVITKFILIEKERSLICDFSLGYGAQLAKQVAPKSMDAKLSSSIAQSSVIHKLQNGVAGVLRLINQVWLLCLR
jgi:hypothetical protein